MNRFQKFKNRHVNQRAVLVANGPSLNDMDLGFLKSEIVIGMNKIFLGIKKFQFYPKYYLAINRKVISQSASYIKSMNCVKFIGSKGAEFVGEDALTYHVNTFRPSERFSRDPYLGIHEGWTVTFAALQLAYFLGFAEVIIIGMDHRYEFIGKPNESLRLEGPDPNHFCATYFGGGQAWDAPDLMNSEESYRIARKEFESAGSRIIDATLNGACTIFDKVDYRKIFF